MVTKPGKLEVSWRKEKREKKKEERAGGGGGLKVVGGGRSLGWEGAGEERRWRV